MDMSAYFAPAFFSHLLGKCLKRSNPLFEVLKLGFVVLGTFSLIWWPYIHSMEALLQVLSRLAPFERGLYEDYVANFWCTTSVVIKWKRLFTTPTLKLLSFGATISTCLPSMIQQIWAPSKRGFLYGLLNSAFSFYLFSFQVHEKSILLPLLPASLLAIEEPVLYNWITLNALFSMFPLLVRDKLVLPYIALLALFSLLNHAAPNQSRGTKETRTLELSLKALVLVCALIFHVVYLTLPAPNRYPFLFEALVMLLCFSQFVSLAFYTNAKQWTLLKRSVLVHKEKKLL
ncbi:probable dolichyl pyrophosphate Man9GlcNAc2 alpha-1,3-glucosyltransferase [Humulus lupulus]|uniref:probable dolichyl pyrophosphate Man9GlcNAc2 alpha-1,3-glucosyltransferase n=1 Tax=Humulus lupulus TaxID=3486 RepID=UPI002B414F25|nr:probable dolichyl pyrophosphate Man9GlcNAc2 alpha-1,3-glucosyltransferase [Humulus lupulus]